MQLIMRQHQLHQIEETAVSEKLLGVYRGFHKGNYITCVCVYTLVCAFVPVCGWCVCMYNYECVQNLKVYIHVYMYM